MIFITKNIRQNERDYLSTKRKSLRKEVVLKKDGNIAS
jgi:hypothetical protein